MKILLFFVSFCMANLYAKSQSRVVGSLPAAPYAVAKLGHKTTQFSYKNNEPGLIVYKPRTYRDSANELSISESVLIAMHRSNELPLLLNGLNVFESNGHRAAVVYFKARRYGLFGQKHFCKAAVYSRKKIARINKRSSVLVIRFT